MHCIYDGYIVEVEPLRFHHVIRYNTQFLADSWIALPNDEIADSSLIQELSHIEVEIGSQNNKENAAPLTAVRINGKTALNRITPETHYGFIQNSRIVDILSDQGRFIIEHERGVVVIEKCEALHPDLLPELPQEQPSIEIYSDHADIVVRADIQGVRVLDRLPARLQR